MTAAEMHAFERAMMDDPFLAEAVDGYRSAAGTIHMQADLDDLKQRLMPDQKEEATIVTGFFKPWMRVAAGLAMLIAISVVMYRSFNVPEQTSKEPVAELTQTDTAATVQTETKVDSTTVAINEQQPAIINPVAPATTAKKETKPKSVPILNSPNKSSIATAEPPNSTNQNNTAIVTAPAPSGIKKEELKSGESDMVLMQKQKKSTVIPFNKFTGVVVDENNQPLPFANITEKKSGVGTYADVYGNFTLIASDSVLNIETKSVGYFSNTLQIHSNQTQRIVLIDQAVIANAPSDKKLYEKNKDRPSAMKTEVNELYTEPADGWNNYSKYVANNLRDENFKEQRQSKNVKEVEVSFDVKPDGTIANLKVERSNCRNCNTEAIRIIKDGPKWKSKTGKTERTHFTVLF